MPLINIEKLARGIVSTSAEPLFPRYLFIRLDSNYSARSWSPIRSTPGVSRLVCFGGSPARVSEDLLHLIKKEEQVAPARPLFQPGDTVLIDTGPFAGIEALYQSTDGPGRSRILLQLLQQQVSLPIAKSALRKSE